MTAKAVIFDFHKTLVVAGSLSTWLSDAERVAGERVDRDAVLPVLREAWTRAGRRYPDTSWDLDPVVHRRAFIEVLTHESPCAPIVAETLYALMPAQWVVVDGVVELLAHLRSRSTRVGLLSNTALDVRPRLAELGLLLLLDDVVLSFEEGLVKPDPQLFERAAARLHVAPRECVYRRSRCVARPDP